MSTFDALLDCSAALLEARGAASFTTNLLAAESGMSVRAIYRYFPNKQAILVELARRTSARWFDAVAAVGELTDPSVPWEPIWRRYLDTWVEAVVATPGGRAVVAAMRDDPVLRAVDDELNDRYIDGVADALRARNPSLRRGRARSVARVLVRSTIGVLDEALTKPRAARTASIAELQEMHVVYIGRVLGEG